MTPVRIKSIEQKDDRTLSIIWTDKRRDDFDVVTLRKKCPCAECIDERTGKQILKPEDVPKSVRPVVIESVGRYALAIRFSDGHKTGIYSFDLLRRIAQ